MKITFLIHGVGIAGGIRAIFECSNRLVDRGHEVNIVYPSVLLKITPQYGPSIFVEQCLRTLGNLRRGVKVDWFDVKAKLIRVFSLSPNYIGYFQKDIPDADVIVASAWETAYSLQKINKSKGRKTYFIQHYEVWDMWNNESCWNSFDKLDPDHLTCGMAMYDVKPSNSYISQIKKMVDKTYTFPYHKLVTSTWLKRFMEEKLDEPVAGVIPIGNNCDLFGVREFREKNNNPLKVLMSFRGITWKGDDDGVKALEIVKKRFPEIEILFFGNMKAEQVPSWATYIERPDDETLKRLYAEADIFVFPSWVEGWGSPPMEAMACGTACITTNVGAVKDYAVHGETAIVVPPRAPERIAEEVSNLVKDKVKREKIARGGFEYIQKFTWDHTVNAMENTLKSIVNGKN